ncbi:hypothetical protein CH294_05975 [Rhodococcus sp. 14-2483-1-1]|uniref:hypothetical protein n=1 Tax=Nocardiaceae TaxID=85025 RepID=UPI00050CBA9D|nr:MULTISPECIES: hypothetical protein [Rhodococcus]OZC41424.1 hypothetical protein CH286_27335 [Rhodococcus sp. WWJCD1]OZC41437.1 hypothetical protein CH286_27400 [Rhodococcus sp. WWJCD1]OZF39770.1 hypothetical protein CH294_05975 [Rhodococcus sp. 14-2483-1-1]
MLFVGLLVAALGAAMMTIATRQLSRVNEGHYLPVIIGKFAVASPLKVTALRVAAQAVSVIGAWTVVTALWDVTNATPAVAVGLIALVAPVAVPVIVITTAHNSRLPDSRRPTS